MEVRELRIGNWVENISSKEQWQITTSDFYEEYTMGQAFFHMKPIPLTEEWLVRLGFEKQINYDEPPYYFTRQATNITCTRFSGLYIDGNEFKLLGKGLPIKYVHQLQNLYFALTGEEL